MLYNARPISKGYGEGEALVCTEPIGFNHAVVIETGVVKERGHQLEGISIKDKVLIFPHGKGSTGGSFVVYQLAKAGTGPKAIINLNTENIIACGAIVGGLPVVDHMESDPFELIENGDWVRVNATSGLVDIVKKGTNAYNVAKEGRLNGAVQILKPASSAQKITLTAEEEDMLEGKHGHPVQIAMNLLVTLGEIYGAEKMAPIRSAHIAGLSVKSHGEAGMLWAEEMAASGARMRVHTTGNVIGVDRSRNIGQPKDWEKMQTRIEKAYEKMGMEGISTCTPYWCGYAPMFGEIVAWAESSAVVYSNSVLGARDNREGGLSAWAAAVTGRVPYYGMHIDENRRGTVLYRVNIPLERLDQYAALGTYIGRAVSEGIPVLENIGAPSLADLAGMGAAMAASGGVAMFHAVGITPEAPTLEAAFAGNSYEVIEVGEKELKEGYEAVTSGKSPIVDFVAIGCPHASIAQLAELAGKLKGKKISPAVKMWVQTSLTNKALARQLGYARIIEESGALLTQDLCTVLAVPEALGASSCATNSGKLAFYGPGANKMAVWFGSLDQCINAAITGVWQEKEDDEEQ